MAVRVNISIVCSFYTAGYRGGACEVEEGSTILEALAGLLEQNGVTFKGNIEDVTICMCNSKQAHYSDVVNEGDGIFIARKIFGG